MGASVETSRTGEVTVELLRHALTRTRRAWSPRDDRDRPLDPAGEAQAVWLARRFKGTGVTAVLSSPAARCVDTVAPIAQSAGCPLRTDERLADLRDVPVTDDGSGWVLPAWLAGRASTVIDDALTRWPEGRIVVCSHGDVLASLLALLSHRDGVPGAAPAHGWVRKGAWVTLRFAGGRCVDAAAHVAAPG